MRFRRSTRTSSPRSTTPTTSKIHFSRAMGFPGSDSPDISGRGIQHTFGHRFLFCRLDFEFLLFVYFRTARRTVRTRHHLDFLKKSLASSDEVGKKLDFIAQEVHREVNTIASKAQNFEIAEEVIRIKSELEKIREQVQNIE